MTITSHRVVMRINGSSVYGTPSPEWNGKIFNAPDLLIRVEGDLC